MSIRPTPQASSATGATSPISRSSAVRSRDPGLEQSPTDAPEPGRVAAVALDMDGLLFDTEKIYWELGDTVLGRRGHRYTAELQARMMGRVGLSAVQQMIDHHSLEDSAEDLLGECDGLFTTMIQSGVEPMPGLGELMQTLRSSRTPFGLTTSNRRKFVDVMLAGHTWATELAFRLTGDDVTRGKPDPEMYQRAAEQFGVPPSRMMVLEDSENGCRAAVAAGAVTIAVPNEHTRHQDFRGVDYIARSLADPEIRRRLGAGFDATA